jgi:hypothetical protein
MAANYGWGTLVESCQLTPLEYACADFAMRVSMRGFIRGYIRAVDKEQPAPLREIVQIL